MHLVLKQPPKGLADAHVPTVEIILNLVALELDACSVAAFEEILEKVLDRLEAVDFAVSSLSYRVVHVLLLRQQSPLYVLKVNS